jgi:hypothetical protein
MDRAADVCATEDDTDVASDDAVKSEDVGRMLITMAEPGLELAANTPGVRNPTSARNAP